MIVAGNKLNEIAQRYFNDNKKRNLVSEVLKLVDTLNSKRKKINFSNTKLDRNKNKKTQEVLNKELIVIRKEKKTNKSKTLNKKKVLVDLKLGDKVRLEDSTSVGTIDKIEKNNATVNYGTFITKVDLNRLEYVK
jgi:DNA mismatch repair protein MutS2